MPLIIATELHLRYSDGVGADDDGSAMSSATLLQAFIDYRRDLLRFLNDRLGSASLAGDVAQDLYVKLHRGEGLAPVHDPRAYLFSMAANLATDHLRVERRRGEILAENGPAAWDRVEEMSPERIALAREELAHIEVEVARLPRRARTIFYLHRYEGRTQEQIAAALGVGVTTVYKDLKTVMRTLVAARRRLRGDGA
jgi:RNA polymerase sigma-70 factor (ECF subfamily)